jgi:hypothetical protein
MSMTVTVKLPDEIAIRYQPSNSVMMSYPTSNQLNLAS